MSDFFLPYQNDWITDDSILKIAEKSRRVGYTYATSYRCNDKCLRRTNFTQWVSSRDLLTAKEFVTDYIAKWAKASNAVAEGLAGDNVQVIDELRGITAFVVEYANGNRIVSLSSTPEAFAGKGGDVLLDEVDLHNDPGALIDMAIPCTTWGGSLEAVSAYRVDGSPDSEFARLVAEAKKDNPMGWSLHTCTLMDAVEQGFVEKLNEVTGRKESRDEFITRMRNQCRNEAAWLSQYMCQPQDDGGALLPYSMIASCQTPDKPPMEGQEYLGMDIGREKDLTVLWHLRRSADVLWTAGVRVLEKTPFREQLEVLGEYMRRPQLVRCCIDATGIGAMLAEEAQRLYGQYKCEAVKFTAPVKEELAMGMMPLFQDRQIRLPVGREISEDLHKVRKVVTKAGNIRYDAARDDDGHADRFWALGLAISAAGQQKGVEFMPQAFNTGTDWGRM